MPDMPQAAPAPGGGGPPPDQGGGDAPPADGGGGGFGDAIVQVDATLNKITQAVTQNPKIGDDVKSAFQAALTAFRGASNALVQAVGGEGAEGGEEESPDAAATTPQEGGAPGAMPMTHQNMRGG